MHPSVEAARREAEREARRSPGFSVGRQVEESIGGAATVVVSGREYGMSGLGTSSSDEDCATGESVLLIGPRNMPVRLGSSPWHRGE